jgi:hypothetical protein
MKSLRILILTALILACASCTRAPREQPESTSTAETEPSVVGEAVGEVPFEITVNERSPDNEMQITVTSDQPAIIGLYSPQNTESELRVIHPGGESENLGQWSGEVGRFLHRFPYGENHLIVQYGDTVYDFLVVAGPPQPQPASQCEGAYIELNPGVSWEYAETSELDYPATRVYRIDAASVDEEGRPHYNLIMERYGGVERKIDTILSLDLYCADGIIYITRAIQQAHNFESDTVYDEGTIYMPAEITAGTFWSRHGSYMETADETTSSYDLTESITCTAVETVTVEAGEFEAAKTESASFSGTSWYVPGIGRVLSIGQIEGSPRLELVSYEGVSAQSTD